MNGFNGEIGDKCDRNYDQWRYDVKMLQMGNHEPQSLRYEVIRSLTGVPGNRVRDLGLDATVDDMIRKLDTHYCPALTYEGLTRNLYSIAQKGKETVCDYDGRLGRAMAMLRMEFPEQYRQENVEDKRRRLFFEGLRGDLQNAITYLMDAHPPATYEQLLQGARHAERRNPDPNRQVSAAPTNPTPRSAFRRPWATPQAQQATIVEEVEPEDKGYRSDEYDEATREEADKIALHAAMNAKKTFYDQNKGKREKRPDGCWNCGADGHFARECPKPKNVSERGATGGKPLSNQSRVTASDAQAPAQ